MLLQGGITVELYCKVKEQSELSDTPNGCLALFGVNKKRFSIGLALTTIRLAAKRLTPDVLELQPS
jgi:hypothetical protein